MNNSGYKCFQDFEPVVLRKTQQKSKINEKSKSNIHINDKKSIETDELPPPKAVYSFEQLNEIKNVRELCELTQEQASAKIGSVPKDFFNKIESNRIPFNQITYNTIIRTLNRILKNKNKQTTK
jgi:hypothetical protein